MATKNTKTTSTRKKTPTRKPQNKNQQKTRELYGIIYLLATVLVVFTILNFDGFLISWIYKIITFCIGYGIYILPFSFLSMAIYCFKPFAGNVPLRSCCILGFPISISCFMQIVFSSVEYKMNLPSLSLLVENALLCKSAGFIGGYISIILTASLSSVGASILLFAFIISSVFIGYRISPRQVLRSVITFFDQIKYEDENEDEEENIDDSEYMLKRREMKKAKKEKQKEHDKALKEKKKQALEEYKKEIEIPKEKPRKKFNIDINLGATTKKEEKEIKEEVKADEHQDAKEERPEVEAWIVEAYEKIKERDEKQRDEREKLKEKIEEKENIFEGLEFVMNVDKGKKEIALKGDEEDTSFSSKNLTLLENTTDIDTQEIENFNNRKLNIIQDLEEMQEEEKLAENAEDLENLEENLEELEQNSEDLETDLEENVQEEQGVENNDEPENLLVDEFDPLAIKKAIEETFDEDTREYVFSKKEIIPDLLKSTMKYETVSGFDASTLEYKYTYPPISLLNPKIKNVEFDPKVELAESSNRLVDTLKSFGVEAQIIHIVRGPSITRFEITISKGVKFSKITGLADDIALALGAVNVRIAPIPDKVAIGIEIPNKTTEMVLISEVIDNQDFKNTTSKLSYALGHDITGSPAIGDIAKMPHMLIAGTTGSGKSVCVNSMLVSLLYKADPTEVKFIMIDPKMVELGGYNGIPHLLIPVVTDPKKAAGALNWAVGEMMKRYALFAECNTKNLEAYNMLMVKKMQEGDETATKLPQIVIVIDELADLMMIAAKEVEESICRIAQMARAAGMHLVIATQRPSSDVITGIMKANIPSRISFAVSSQIESRIILDATGAEKLIGKGDMLYNPLGASKPQRLQGCFITSSEVEEVVEYVKTIAKPDYNDEVMQHIESHAVCDSGSSGSASENSDGSDDPMTEEAIDIIVSTGQASTSFLQRKLRLGYGRASRIIDEIEERGIISAPDGSKPRQVLITKQQWQEMKIRKMD